MLSERYCEKCGAGMEKIPLPMDIQGQTLWGCPLCGKSLFEYDSKREEEINKIEAEFIRKKGKKFNSIFIVLVSSTIIAYFKAYPLLFVVFLASYLVGRDIKRYKVYTAVRFMRFIGIWLYRLIIIGIPYILLLYLLGVSICR